MSKLLIIETINNRFASEGKTLEQALNLILDCMDQRKARHLEIEYFTAFTKSKFMDRLKHECEFLHISSHGTTDNGLEKGNRHVLEIGRKEERGQTIKNGRQVTPNEIKELEIKAKTVFVSACFSGHNDMANAFFNDRRKGVYIGPCRRIDFEKAFLVALHFYRGAFLEKSLRKGMNNISKDYTMGPHGTYYYFQSPRDIKE